MRAIFSLISIYLLFLFSCTQKKRQLSYYQADQLYETDSNKVHVDYFNDTILEIRDNRKDSNYSYGLYTFDQKGFLRFYGFFVDNNKYRYSEEYDSMGNLLKKEGSPLVEYRLWRKDKDTILITAFLFSLNKKYEQIELFTNKKDTVRPMYLYRSNLYSNVKCFSFKLKIDKIKDLKIYARGIIKDTCVHYVNLFSDTTSFENIKI